MHLSLNVADLERSVAFYAAFFGAPPHKRRPGYANFDLDRPPLKLALEQAPPGAAPAAPGATGPLNHLGVQVEDPADVQAARDRLVAAGLATFDERDVTCCYARQDKVWATDPDGNRWEVYALLADADERGDGALPPRPLPARRAPLLRVLPSAGDGGGGGASPPCCGDG